LFVSGFVAAARQGENQSTDTADNDGRANH
jgi:hypothetical protein